MKTRTSEAETQAQAGTISVALTHHEPRRYDILVQNGLLREIGTACASVLPSVGRVLVLTDSNLADHYLPIVQNSLQEAGFSVFSCVIPAGESSKTLEQAQKVYDAALAANLSRKDTILGLGGGVIGDLAGFCASTWHRGAQLIHVPTTLVAQVDSAIGGKTAVNFGQVKNMVGTFYQPRMVLADPETLQTLPPRELSAGLAEVVKYGLIETSCTGETGFFDWLVEHADHLEHALPEMIRRCAAIKAAVVMQDETETKGLRHFLNLGHTFGHAYESLSGYNILHGEAVAIGLEQAARLSVHLDLLPESLYQQVSPLLTKLGLGHALAQQTNYPPEALIAAMRQDKKNLGDCIRLILPEQALGRVTVRTDIPAELILQVLSGK
ncbi:MAG TPA: 3-dehydroquinate synthase [Oculatellaceae cyanobacterium]|jgi:3-dehydroquinate synthase